MAADAKVDEVVAEIQSALPETANAEFGDKFLRPLVSSFPADLIELPRHLAHRDGAAKLAIELGKCFPPETVLEAKFDRKGKNQRAWELVGYFYRNLSRFHESLAIFDSLYNHMLAGQSIKNRRGHKGVPLVLMSECYTKLGYPVLAKRYLMLTLCEDAIALRGRIDPNPSGIYFRLVWFHGLSDAELNRYSREIYALYKKNPREGRFPESLLQKLDQDWMIEVPSAAEALIFRANNFYIKHLLAALGDGSGRKLETLSAYLLSCMPGCKTYTRVKTLSSDLDVVCALEGFDLDFRSELGRYFVCECKDWNKPADFTTLAKFCRVLDSAKCRFGVLFSREGISGKGTTRFAEREQLKVFQDRGMVIVVVDRNDLEKVANGENFISMLRRKYRRIRLDLPADSD